MVLNFAGICVTNNWAKTQRNDGALSIITHKRQLIQLGNDSNNHQCPSSVNSRSPQPPPFPSFFSNNRTLPSGDCPFNLRYNYTTKTLWDSENDSDLIRVAKCHRYDRYIRLKIFVVVEVKNIARVRNCPDITTLNSLFGVCLFVFLSFCLFVLLSFFLSFLSFFCLLSRHHSYQMSEGSQVSKVTICLKILKWQSLTHSLIDQGQV